MLHFPSRVMHIPPQGPAQFPGLSYTYIQKVLATGPLALWTLGDASGSVATELVNGWNGTYSNPTLAAGDVVYEIDGVAGGNLGTLPVVTPAGTRSVKVVMTAGEMNGDNIVVKFVDQTSPKEWSDMMIVIQTSANQIDDLALAATALSTAVWTGTKAGYLDAAVSGAVSGAGSGAISWVYTLTDSVTTLPIANANVWVTTDLAGTNVIRNGTTDAFGIVTFNLDAGTYYYWRQKSGYNFTDPDTEVVS